MTAIPLIPEPCPGRRSALRGRRWSICSTCDVQDDNGTAEPAAVMQGDQPVCPNRRFHGQQDAPAEGVGVSLPDGGGVPTSNADQELAA